MRLREINCLEWKSLVQRRPGNNTHIHQSYLQEHRVVFFLSPGIVSELSRKRRWLI
jgi:hypothetical protein